MSDFWYRVRKGRCSISIALMKSTRFLLAFVNSATVDEKSWITCRSLKVFTDFFKRKSHCKREERVIFFLSQKNRKARSVITKALFQIGNRI